MIVQLSRIQSISLWVWLVLGTGILTLPFAVGQFVARDGWIVALLFGVASLFVAGIVALFVRSFPGQSLVEGCFAALGPVVGRVAGLWVLVWIFLKECMILREMSEFVHTTVFSTTPMFVIAAVFMVPVAYSTYLGLEVVGRMAEIITPIGIGVSTLLYFLALQYADPAALLPVLADGWNPVLRGVVTPWTYAWEFVVILQIQEAAQQQRLVKDVLTAILILTLAGVVAELTITLTLGPSATYSAYPILEVVRTIRLGGFLERLDSLYVMGVITTIYLKMSLFHYSLTTGIRQWFRLSHYRPTVFSAAAAVLSGSLFFVHNNAMLQDYIMNTAWGYFAFTGAIIPILAVVVHRLRRRNRLT
ncbi:MAG: endospore germination permease [Kyrpidia sp.]|nr:endospore germination permease [Kyrpidia sp.]